MIVGVNDNHREGKQRHLVCHDYGMGGLWWWVWARSPAEIVETCAEVEVVTDPERIGLNPPFDLLDPQYARLEISQAQFEEVWGRARPMSGEP
jgi:hypothetical protein